VLVMVHKLRVSICLIAAVLIVSTSYGIKDDFPKVLSNQKLTQHFCIYTNYDPKWLDFYADFFEGFYKYFEENYFVIDQALPLNIYLFTDEESYKPYATSVLKTYTSYGFYMGKGSDTIVVNRESGLGTATHEIVHYFIDCGFKKEPPSWIEEGTAAFFEKFMGYIDEQGNLSISFGYFSDWRFPIVKQKIDTLSLRKIIMSEDVDQSAARSLMVYLNKKKMFADCLKKWQTSDKDPYGGKILQEVYGKPIHVIEQDWKNWVKSQPINEDVNLVQHAFVLRKTEWDQWRKADGNRLYWDENEKLYKVKQALKN
jgi:hypothetical protein